MVTYDNEYTFYEFNNDRFKNFNDYGYSGNISIAMAKLSNQILKNPDIYLESINVTETKKEEFTNRYKGERLNNDTRPYVDSESK